MSVGEFVAGVDRLLTRGHGLFPGAGTDGGVFAADGGSGGGSVPQVPVGGSGLGGGVSAAGGQYGRVRAGVAGLDVASGQVAGEGAAVGAAGRSGAGVIRDQARSAGVAAGPLASSPAGVRLLVATMDEHLAEMQRQLQVTMEQNRVLAVRLRQLAMAYRGLGGGGAGGLSSLLSGMGSLPLGGGGGGGGLSGLSGLAGLPSSLMGRSVGGMGGSGRTVAGVSGQVAAGAAGVAQGSIPVSEVSFEGKGVWTGGREAVRRYLEEALDRLGISDPRARGHWIAGMTTIAEHESGFRTDAINLVDSNAHGARQVDGGPQNSSRGVWQLVPGTFAHYHQPGTSNHIWDPVANACASINYQMARYGVAADGHNQRALVGQANPGVHQGY